MPKSAVRRNVPGHAKARWETLLGRVISINGNHLLQAKVMKKIPLL